MHSPQPTYIAMAEALWPFLPSNPRPAPYEQCLSGRTYEYVSQLTFQNSVDCATFGYFGYYMVIYSVQAVYGAIGGV